MWVRGGSRKPGGIAHTRLSADCIPLAHFPLLPPNPRHSFLPHPNRPAMQTRLKDEFFAMSENYHSVQREAAAYQAQLAKKKELQAGIADLDAQAAGG